MLPFSSDPISTLKSTLFLNRGQGMEDQSKTKIALVFKILPYLSVLSLFSFNCEYCPRYLIHDLLFSFQIPCGSNLGFSNQASTYYLTSLPSLKLDLGTYNLLRFCFIKKNPTGSSLARSHLEYIVTL